MKTLSSFVIAALVAAIHKVKAPIMLGHNVAHIPRDTIIQLAAKVPYGLPARWQVMTK